MNARTTLMTHQQTAVDKTLPSRIGGLFMEMGTGKSRTAIELVQRRQEKIDYVIWFCPVSLKETIRQEILKHTDSGFADIHVFSDRTNEGNIPKCFWYVIGIESMSSSARVVTTVNKLITKNSMVIVDESSYIKGHNSDRTLRITHISQRAKYRLILTGTPISQGVVDLFAQMRFLSPKILGYNSFYSFAANHLEYSEKYKGMIVRSHNTQYLAAKIKPYIYQVTKEECLDLPDKLHETRYFYLTSEQREAYERAKYEILMENKEDDWDSITIFRLFTALQQIVCGFWNWKPRKATAVERYEYEHGRVDLLLDTIHSIPQDQKVIIWAKYLHDIDHIQSAIASQFGSESIAPYHGRLNENQRAAQVEHFRGEARFFLATPSCGGHGLTLNEAHYVIFYNNGFKYSERIQAEDRCHRIGQDHKVCYIDLVCSDTIDERIMSAIEKKGSVVKDFKREVDKAKGKKTTLKELLKAL